MRHAPPAVEFPIPGTGLHRLAAAAVPGATAAALVAWLWSWSVQEPASLIDSPKAPWALLALVAVLGAAIAHSMWRPARGGLRWDGGSWYWLPRRDDSRSDAGPGSDHGVEPDPVALATVRVQWDLGAWLLVKAKPDHGGRSLRITAARQAAPTRWHALRVALYHPCGLAPSDPKPRP